jgi:hypothetical protein
MAMESRALMAWSNQPLQRFDLTANTLESYTPSQQPKIKTLSGSAKIPGLRSSFSKTGNQQQVR